MSKKQKPASPRFDTLSFLSDFGHEDEFVGVTKSVVYEIAPTTRIVDISHSIPPYDIRAGALALARSAGYLCPGVVLAVVDPGVGSTRRAIAVEVGGGSSILVGPDNGLLAPAVAMVGGANRAVELTNTQYHLPTHHTQNIGTTFAARDIFAPCAAHIIKGVELTELGDEIDTHSLTPQLLPVSRTGDGANIKADILWIDRFGNAQLNLEPKDLEALHKSNTKLQITFGDNTRTLKFVDNYAELDKGELGIILDSYGLLAIVVDQSSASLELGLKEGDEVELKSVSMLL